MKQKQQLASIIYMYKQKTGKVEIDMHEIAKFALELGWTPPKQESDIDRLAKRFAQMAREEVRRDDVTKRPYRAYHNYTVAQGTEQLHLWVDIDDAPRPIMLKSAVTRREQMVSDGLQLTLDLDHWNSIHPDEEPISLPMDMTDDIEWRKNSLEDDIAVAA